MMGSSLVFEKRTSLLPSSRFLLDSNNLCLVQRRNLSVKRNVRSTSGGGGVVAAISEKLVRVVPEKPVKFKVRAVVTVRKNHKEDLKEALVKHFDALTDMMGRNIVLELISTEINPSKTSFPFPLFSLISD